MQLMICDPLLIDPILADRREREIDGHDEIWDGIYMIMPILDDEHQELAIQFGTILLANLGGWERRHHFYFGVNVSDRNEDWLHNVRVPDFAVYLAGSKAKERGTHWQGGPDFGVEIVTPGDLSRQKLDFYSQVGARELLLIDRSPWALELYALKRKKLKLVGRSTLEQPTTLESTILPFSMRLVAGTKRPCIEVGIGGHEHPWLA